MKSKTIRKFVFILFAVFIFAAQSFAGRVSIETSDIIRETIKECVKHPGFVISDDNPCTADVDFTISIEGKLLIKNITTDNESLSSYLTEQLSQIVFCCVEGSIDQAYHIKLTFRLL